MCNCFAELTHFFALRNKNQIAMSKVKFYPWIGKNWGVSFGGKLILVLGESHYCASPADAYPGMTWDIIKDLFDPNSPHEPYKNTYTKFAKALSGKFDRMTIADKEELWESVAFYNYIQEPLTGPRTAPSDAQFKASEEAFEEVVDTWQPDVIIAWGTASTATCQDGAIKAETFKDQTEPSLKLGSIRCQTAAALTCLA